MLLQVGDAAGVGDCSVAAVRAAARDGGGRTLHVNQVRLWTCPAPWGRNAGRRRPREGRQLQRKVAGGWPASAREAGGVVVGGCRRRKRRRFLGRNMEHTNGGGGIGER